MTERERDERDLKILDDLCLAAKYSVSLGHVRRLWRAWKQAA